MHTHNHHHSPHHHHPTSQADDQFCRRWDETEPIRLKVCAVLHDIDDEEEEALEGEQVPASKKNFAETVEVEARLWMTVRTTHTLFTLNELNSPLRTDTQPKRVSDVLCV